jgi:hypothetical protein
MEAEYIAAYYAAQDIVWFRALLSDLDLQDPNKPTTLFFFVEYRFYYKCWCAGLRPPTICTKSSLAYNA